MQCKNVQVVETSSLTIIENTQGSDDQSSMLPPVPLDTKIDEVHLKAHIMKLYPDLFDGVRTQEHCCSFRCEARCNSYSMFTQEHTRCTSRFIKGRIRQNGVIEGDQKVKTLMRHLIWFMPWYW